AHGFLIGRLLLSLVRVPSLPNDLTAHSGSEQPFRKMSRQSFHPGGPSLHEHLAIRWTSDQAASARHLAASVPMVIISSSIAVHSISEFNAGKFSATGSPAMPVSGNPDLYSTA